MSEPRPMSRFAHWIVDCALRHNAAVAAAKALDPTKVGGHGPGGRSPGEAELSRLNVALYERLHSIEAIVREHGIEGTFGTPDQPLTEEEKAAVRR